jgi:hypothetical protein
MSHPKPSDRKLIPLDYACAAERRPPARIQLWLVYGLMCLSNALLNFALPVQFDLGLWIRSRNMLRAESGPAQMLDSLGAFGGAALNDLTLAAVAFVAASIVLFALVRFTPIRRAPLVVHFAIAFAWFYGGCIWSLSD